MMKAILGFFQNDRTEQELLQFPQLSYGCLLFLVFTKANLFCSANHLFYEKEKAGNIVYNRFKSTYSYVKTACCTEEDCDQTLQVVVHDKLRIKIKERMTNLAYTG